MEDLKENRCTIIFMCDHAKQDPCVYHSGGEYCCKHRGLNYRCLSTVANVNKMTVELKNME